MRRYEVIVSGRVQNVGFRTFASTNAMKCDLTGEVMNLENGDVKMYVQGSQADIDRFLALTKQGNRFIRVDSLTVSELPVRKDEKKFSYRW